MRYIKFIFSQISLINGRKYLPILVDAKTEYTKQLINILTPEIYKGIKDIYNNSKQKSIDEEQYKNTYDFQNDLSEIPKWSQVSYR